MSHRLSSRIRRNVFYGRRGIPSLLVLFFFITCGHHSWAGETATLTMTDGTSIPYEIEILSETGLTGRRYGSDRTKDAASSLERRETHIGWGELTRVEWPSRQPDVSLAPSREIRLSNGDRLCGAAGTTMEDSLNVSFPDQPGWMPIAIPLEEVAAIIFDVPESRTARDKLFQALRHHRDDLDLIVLRNGDRLAHQFSELTDDACLMSHQATARAVPRLNLAAIAFSPSLQVIPKLPDNYWRLSLRDRSQLTCSQIEFIAEHRVRLTLVTGSILTLPQQDLLAVRRYSPSCVDAWTQPAKLVSITPWLGSRSPELVSESIPWKAECHLSGGCELPRSLITPPRTQVILDVPERMTLLQGELSWPDSALASESATIRVQADSEFTTILDRGRCRAVFTCRVTAGKTVTLTTDFADSADVGQGVLWSDLRFVSRDAL